MNKTEILRKQLSLLTEVPITAWDEKNEKMNELLYQFAQHHCFLPSIQKELTSSYLAGVCPEIKSQCIYEIHDPLGILIFLFRYEDVYLLLGPVVEKAWSDSEANQLMTRFGLPAEYFVPFKLYYCNLRIFPAVTAVPMLLALLEGLSPEAKPYEHQIFAEHMEERGRALVWEEPPDFDMAVQRYQMENEMIRMVIQGRSKEAIDALERLNPMSAGLKLPFMSMSRNDRLTSISIIRTMVRKAAESAGVHPAIVDSISQSYAQRFYAAGTSAEFSNLKREMIAEFCEAVRTVRREKYSPAIRRAADYIKLHLSSQLTLQEIAARAEVSPNYLSHVFKEETGLPVLRYIAGKRCEKAAELLLHTKLSVQDISCYVGYLDSNYFVKVFRSQYQITPTEYRKRGWNF